MIKKTTKILTLLLAGLLIISSMSVLSVSANTTPTILVGSAEVTQGSGVSGIAEVSVPVTFEGALTLASFQISIAYDTALEFTKYAPGDVVSGISKPKAGKNPVNLAWFDADAEGIDIESGTVATLTFNVPTTTAKEYALTVTLKDFYDATDANITSTVKTVNGKVSVKAPAGPVITFTNGAGEAIDDVVAGTMNLNVALNGADYDFIMFAVYTKEGEFASMKYFSPEATIENGVATAKIENITLDAGKNYYAKAFVWDKDTYYGLSQTIGE